MTGPWWGWDPNAGPVASDNGDGTWIFTFDPAPTDNMEYLLVVDGVQEDLVASGTASGDWSCTPITDYFGYANRQWTVGSGDVSNVYGQCGACEAVVVSGCMDANASNYDSAATEQSFDDFGNPACIYASCEDIPDAEGCIYANAYASYGEGFGPAECTLYGGTACTVAAIGCMDANASNYDDTATEQSYDQYGNSTCIYASCADIPEYGCIYADGFGAFNANFNAANCVQYGGTPCEAPSTAGCLDENASNYDATATEQAFDQYGNFVCIYASCDDVPEYGCIYSDGFGAFSSDATFTGAQCIEYGGIPCEEPAGCTDPLFVEFDPSVTLDDGSCSELVVEGCAYADADNYDVSANTDDGSCLFTLGSTCPGDFSGDGFVNVSDLGGFLGAFGEACD
jgi:hypothetical protein